MIWYDQPFIVGQEKTVNRILAGVICTLKMKLFYGMK